MLHLKCRGKGNPSIFNCHADETDWVRMGISGRSYQRFLSPTLSRNFHLSDLGTVSIAFRSLLIRASRICLASGSSSYFGRNVRSFFSVREIVLHNPQSSAHKLAI